MAYFDKTIIKNINNNDIITIKDYLPFLSKGDTCTFKYKKVSPLDKKINIEIAGIVTKIHHDISIEYNANNDNNIYQTIYIDVC